MPSGVAVQGGRRRTRLAWSLGQHGHQRQPGGVGLLRPNLQHGPSFKRGNNGSAIGSGCSGSLGHFGTALSIQCAGATSHSASFERQRPKSCATHGVTKSGLRVFGFCPAGSTREIFSGCPIISRQHRSWACQIQTVSLTIPIAFLCWRGHTHNLQAEESP